MILSGKYEWNTLNTSNRFSFTTFSCFSSYHHNNKRSLLGIRVLQTTNAGSRVFHIGDNLLAYILYHTWIIKYY